MRIKVVVVASFLLALVAGSPGARHTAWAQVTEEAKLEVPDASFAGKGAAVGWAVAVSGETVVVGAPGDNNPNNPNHPGVGAGSLSGSASVFVRTGAVWSLEAMLFPSDLAAGDHFGRSVSIEGNTVVVGAMFDDDGSSDAGSAYVFERIGTTWTEVAKLVPSTPEAGLWFGMGIALSGDTVVVGAPSEFFGHGEAYVFTRPPSGWAGTLSETAKLTQSDSPGNDKFGWAVAASGDTVVVGAYLHPVPFTASGSAYVFEKPPSGWTDTTETAKLMPSDTAAEGWFGESVALFGDTALVGAPTDGTGAGAAYFFTRPGAGWAGTLNEDSKLTPSDGSAGDFFGEGVGLSPNRAIIGAPHAKDSSPPVQRVGAAYLFVNDGTGWTEEAKYVGNDSQDMDQFGKSAAIGDDIAIVGAHRDRLPPTNGQIGSAYIFDADLGVIPKIAVTKRSNGADADDPDDPDVPTISIGDTVTWSYEIENTGGVAVDQADVLVTDSQVGINPLFDSEVVGNADTLLDPGEIWLYEAAGTAIDTANPPPGVTVSPNVCTSGGTAPASAAYTNLGTVAIPGASASDPSSYCNPLPAIDIEKATNGIDADNPADGTAPQLAIGDAVSWSYTVTNSGNVRLVSVVVADDQGVVVSCPEVTLEVAEAMICSATGSAENLTTTTFTTVLGTCGGLANQLLYENLGSVSALSEAGVPVGDTDSSHYCNRLPAIDIEKTTNGIDADDPADGTAPPIAIGDPVSWSYAVTNTGNVRLIGVGVVDDQGVAVSCPQTSLEVAEAMICAASGVAEDLTTTAFSTVLGTCVGVVGELLYENIATVNALSEVGDPVSDLDMSHYCNRAPVTAAWKLDEGTGTLAADEAGISDGTVVHATWVPGVSGTALDFDGQDDHVVIANTGALEITGTEITLVAWIYPHDGGAFGGSRVISKRTDPGGSDVYSMYTYQNRLRFRLDGQDMISSQTFVVDRWHHVAMVYDGVDKRIYINGVLDAATPQPKSDAIDVSSRAVHLGMREGQGRRFNGLIDEVRIYDRALAAQEIAQLTTITVVPDGATLGNGEQQQYVATGFDQYGDPFPVLPTWSATGGTITPQGLYTAGAVLGSFTVTAELGSASDSATLTIVYSPPAAEAGGPYTGSEGSDIPVDGSASTDPDDDIVAWDWDFNGIGDYDDASGASAIFNSNDSGVFAIALRITDTQGLTGTDTATVTVDNVAPSAVAGGPYDGGQGADINLDASGSSDPGNDIVSYEWDLDDDGQYDDAAGVNALFSVSGPGMFSIGLRVTDADGATDVDLTTVTVTGTEEAKLEVPGASSAGKGAAVGWTVAVSGETVVVGAPGDNNPNNPMGPAGALSGSAGVFVRSGAAWSLEAQLFPSDLAPDDHFGRSVAIEGDTVVVGAFFDDDGGSDAGSAYVFERTGTTWTEVAKLVPSTPEADLWFGMGIALSGDTIVVGAPSKFFGHGEAYVFTRPPSGWAGTLSETAKLTQSDSPGNDKFGWAVAASGDTVVVGAYLHPVPFTASGSAYVFEKPPSGWTDTTETAKLMPSDTAAEGWFGESVALFGDTALVGAPTDGTGAGAAYVFTRPGAGWAGTLNQDVKLTPSDGSPGDFFGDGVALSGARAVIGAPHFDGFSPPLPRVGAAYLFVNDGTGWTEEAKYVGNDSQDRDEFGKSAAIADDIAIVGAHRDRLPPTNGQIGSAYVLDADLVSMPGIAITKRTNSADANDPDGLDVPTISIGDALTWSYEIENIGSVSVDQADVLVTDSQPGINPLFDSEVAGNADAILDPGEIWLYGAAGTAIDTANPPPGVTVSPNVCTLGGTAPASPAYTNVGTVAIPGASASDPSSYCNPVLTTITVAPEGVVLSVGETQQYTATSFDQQGNPFPVTPIWSATGGTITPLGLYTAGVVGGPFVVTADDGPVSGSAGVVISLGPPTAEAGGPYTGNEGSDIPVDGAGSTAGASAIVAWDWDLDDDGDYDDASGGTATFNSVDSGVFTIGLLVTAADAATDTDTATVTVANVAPTADAGGPYSDGQGIGIPLDGSASSDPGNDIVSYEWDLDDDGDYDDASGATALFDASGPGVFPIGLRVTDADGDTGTAATTVTVNDTVPAAPTGLSAIGTDGEVSLNWNDNSELDLAGYRVYRATSSGGPHTDVSGLLVASDYLDSTVTNDVTYYYVVTAEDATGNESADSAEVPATPRANGLSLVGHWRLDEGSGTIAVDATGNSDGTLVGPTWVPGVGGTALDFDGVDDYVAMDNTAALEITGTQITMAGWIYPHDGGTAGGSRVISKRTDAGGSDVYSMYTYQNRLRFRLDGQDMISAHVFAFNQWLHVAMVYNGVDKRIYVDGVLDAATPQLKSDPINASTRAVHLGMREAEARRYNGFLDEVRIYDRALTAAEVAELAGLAGLNQPPVVDAGPDVTLRLPANSVALDATVTDDGLPIATPVTTWSQLSGPAGVSLGNANAVDTTATFPGVGTYGLQLTADDTEFQSSDLLTVTVEAAPALATIVVTPEGASLSPAQTQQYNTAGFDQYGDPFPVAPSWSATGGTITPLGLYTAGSVAGTFAVTAQDGPVSDSATVSITLSPPTAEAGGPYAGDEGSGIPVDGSGSTDPDNDIVAWDWDFDGDGNYDDASGETVTFTSFDSGAFVIGLRVTDGDGATNADTATVTVDNVTPTAVASGPYSGDQDTNIALDGSSSSDPGNDIVTYEWDLDNDAQFDDASGVTTVFAAAAPGVFTIGLRVTDADGAAATGMATVTVLDTVPAAPLGLAATGSDAQVDLNWNDSPETDLAGYRVYRATASGGPYTGITGLLTASDHQDTTVTNDVTYYYVVTAEDAAGNESINSAEATATPSAGGSIFNEDAKFEVPGAAFAGRGAAVGWTVGVSGETAVVGAPGDNNPNNPNFPGVGAGHLSGSASVFVRNGASWSLQTMLFPSDLALDDHFGRSVAIEGDTLVVGAIYDGDGGTRVGSAYVFERSGTTWTEVAKLVPSTAPADSFFGMGIALSGDTVVVGASSKFWGHGEAYVFTRPPSGWAGTLNEQARLTPSDLTGNEQKFGWAVAVSGDTVLVGAYRANDGGVLSGATYLFEEPPAGWADMTETAKLMPSDPVSDANFGKSVAVFGDTALVGAPTEGAVAGGVYVFTRPGAGWAGTLNEDVKLTPSDGSPGDFFGEGVGLEGARALIGSPHAKESAPPVQRIGAAYLFVNNGTSSIEEAKYVATDSQELDQFGHSAAVSDDIAIVGAHRDRFPGIDGAIGSAYIFDADLAGIPGIAMTKLTNGVDADNPDDPDVPQIPIGNAVTWSYEVENTGNVPVNQSDVLVTDSQAGVAPLFDSVVFGNADAVLEPGEIWLYEAFGTAIDTANPPPGVTVVPGVCTAGGIVPSRAAYTNLGTVTIPGASASDPSSYCNVLPAVGIEKATNGIDADDPADGTAPQVAVGAPLAWTYTVANTGNVRVVSVAVTDDQLGVAVTCPQDILELNEVMTCTANGLAEDLATTTFTTVSGTCVGVVGQLLYENIGTVTALSEAGDPVSDIDPSHYCNAFNGPTIDIEKATNTIDADDPDDGTAPQVEIGDPVTWSYTVRNVGNVALVNVAVTDDQGIAVSCPQTTLAVGAEMTCTASGVAEDLASTLFTTVLGTCGGSGNQLLYENIGTVNAQSQIGDPVSDTDPSHYCNLVPATAAWRLDEGSGTLAADVAGISDGTVVGATWVPGVSGTALDLDGVDDHVAIANTAALEITGTEITLAGWIQPRNGGVSGGSRVISKRTDAGGSDVYSMYTYQNRLRFRLDGQDMVSSQTLTIGGWQHVVMVYDGVDKRIYVNGVLDAALPQLKSDPINASSRAVQLGMREGEARRFNGLVDEVRIYDRALTAEQVAALFVALQPPPGP